MIRSLRIFPLCHGTWDDRDNPGPSGRRYLLKDCAILALLLGVSATATFVQTNSLP